MKTGKIIQVLGPVVDVEFENQELPAIRDALEVQNGDKKCVMEVAQHIGNHVVRCIMLAASVWSLLLPAIERAEQGPLPAWVPPAVGLLLGAVGLLRLETLAGRLLNAGPGRCGRMVLAVTLHNLPEGMVVGLAAALALRGEPDAISGALALALGIGLQNIPEGAAVSLPLAQEGKSKCRAFAAGAASGLVEPLGGLLALALAGWVSAALPWLMSLAAGCMVCVTAQEMIPEAVEADEPAGVISVVAGFALMMALDVAL